MSDFADWVHGFLRRPGSDEPYEMPPHQEHFVSEFFKTDAGTEEGDRKAWEAWEASWANTPPHPDDDPARTYRHSFNFEAGYEPDYGNGARRPFDVEGTCHEVAGCPFPDCPVPGGSGERCDDDHCRELRSHDLGSYKRAIDNAVRQLAEKTGTPPEVFGLSEAALRASTPPPKI